MAEVTLTFDNDDRALALDFAQVQITRRAYRAGESEYFINRNHVRLRDVHELLMGTGLGPGSYAIVSQGQIDAILSSKPTERRSLFEETAGIAKFLARKAEALRRLDGTEQNAIRVNDLIAELERRIPELDAHVRRAKRYRKVSARLRDLEILAYVRASASRREERERVQAEVAAFDESRTRAAAHAAVLGAELSALRNTLYTLELELEAQREAAQAARAEHAGLDAERAAAVARRDALTVQSSSSVADHERAEAERVALRSTIEELDGRLAALGPLADAAREREAGGDRRGHAGAARARYDLHRAACGRSIGRRARRQRSRTPRANSKRADRDRTARRRTRARIR